jgi:hypothetical protein
MIRSIGIVLVIWGLIVQPLMAAMPMTMTDHSTHSTMVSDSSVMDHASGHHGTAQNVGEPSKAPCHEKTTDDTSSGSHNNCVFDCGTGFCASSCVSGGVATFQNPVINLCLQGSTLASSIRGACTRGLPSRIFHPPKYA